MTEGVSPDRWSRLEGLFHQALELPVDRRASLLASVADADADLAGELRSLLAAHGTLSGDAPREPSASLGPASRSFLDTLDPAATAALLRSVGDTDELEPGHRIGRYTVRGTLGRGGMGIVYLARDPTLDREVALKLLPSWLAADDLARRRLLSEARAASALEHPNVQTVYEVDRTDDGGLFIAMAYYPGSTLRDRLDEGPLELGRALDVAIQIVDGLRAAHERGIVHRDVKPANIVLSPEGRVTLVDFGIADTPRAVDDPPDSGGPSAPTGGSAGSFGSGVRVAAGTASYMSPEQVRREPVDGRSDLWSVGVVLFEMLTGRRPFRGADRADLLAAILDAKPPLAGELESRVPRDVVGLVRGCLRKEPSRRFGSADELLADLRRVRDRLAEADDPSASALRRRIVPLTLAVAGAGLVAALALFGIGGSPLDRASTPAPATAPAPLRVVVETLAPAGAAAGTDYLAEGLTEELALRLSRVEGLRVVGNGLPADDRSRELTGGDLAEAVSASRTLSARVARTDENLQVALALTDAGRGQPSWTRTYTVEPGTVHGAQAEMVADVLAAMGLPASSTPSAIDDGAVTFDPEGYDLYLRGRYFWHRRTPEGLRRALDLFGSAVERDSTISPAWAGLAQSYNMLASVGEMPAAEAYGRAEAAARRALALDPGLAEAHVSLGTLLFSRRWDAAGASEHYRAALAANPSYALAHQRHSNLLAAAGRHAEAVARAQEAVALDPLSVYARANLGWILYLAGRLDEARSHLIGTREMEPEFYLTHLDLGLVELADGRIDAAAESFRTAVELGEDPAARALLARTMAEAGDRDEARAALARLESTRRDVPVSPIHLAQIHIGLGELERAASLVARSVDERHWLIPFLEVEPTFRPLRSEPPFRELLRRTRPARELDGSG